MLVSLLLYYILFIFLISGDNVEPTKDQNITKIKDNSTKLDHQEVMKLKNITIVTEGGSTVQSNPVILSKQNDTSLPLDAELGKDKTFQGSSVSKVKGRKGVSYVMEGSIEETKEEKHASPLPQNSTVKPTVASQSSKNVSSSLPKPLTKKEPTITTTSRPTKPLILSNVPLDKEAARYADFKTLTMSSNKNDLDQAGPSKQIKQMSASRHPGMVMPIVITILVVPMFAVLGYMALRRGQEAWKNRHYKRMDFLLDGMYNE